MCCSFGVIQGARVEIYTDASNFTPAKSGRLVTLDYTVNQGSFIFGGTQRYVVPISIVHNTK
jgi:hypothetical protein